jgi:DNA (cytosine-5)-methyltransferase 1
MSEFTFISLFAGIGGMDLGLERTGLRCIAQVEIDDYATRVLERRWPDVPRWRDVRDCGAHNLPSADVICGGFPCQDISEAGKGAGLAGERSGLWREFYRIPATHSLRTYQLCLDGDLAPYSAILPPSGTMPIAHEQGER